MDEMIFEYTGERMVPEKADLCTFWEHIYRYRFASRFVNGKRVLDIACGEGYGAAAFLKAGAADVTGVDICPEICLHAARKYGIKAKVGDGLNIPLPSASVDVVVSFETIEHINEPERFVAECARVLRNAGTFIVSTPNRDVYRRWSPSNPYHCAEMDENGFIDVLKTHFDILEMHSQRVQWAVWWSWRGIAAEEWLWRRIPPVRRIISHFQRHHCRDLVRDREAFRGDPVRTILQEDPPRVGPLNPFAIRPRLRDGIESPVYFIAVARKQESPVESES